jgi:CRISPR/Cas system endoribonuclease Cas6 (RAMP superfamily)
VVISARSEEARYARYLSPTDEGYALMVKNNLTQKWATIPGALMLPEPFDFEMVVTSQPNQSW